MGISHPWHSHSHSRDTGVFQLSSYHGLCFCFFFLGKFLFVGNLLVFSIHIILVVVIHRSCLLLLCCVSVLLFHGSSRSHPFTVYFFLGFRLRTNIARNTRPCFLKLEGLGLTSFVPSKIAQPTSAGGVRKGPFFVLLIERCCVTWNGRRSTIVLGRFSLPVEARSCRPPVILVVIGGADTLQEKSNGDPQPCHISGGRRLRRRLDRPLWLGGTHYDRVCDHQVFKLPAFWRSNVLGWFLSRPRVCHLHASCKWQVSIS